MLTRKQEDFIERGLYVNPDNCPEEWWDNSEFVLEILKRDSEFNAFAHSSRALREDKTFLLKAVETNGWVLSHTDCFVEPIRDNEFREKLNERLNKYLDPVKSRKFDRDFECQKLNEFVNEIIEKSLDNNYNPNATIDVEKIYLEKKNNRNK